MREEVVLARTDQGDGLTRVMVEYVSLFYNYNKFYKFYKNVITPRRTTTL
jgi:hypothetical protein